MAESMLEPYYEADGGDAQYLTAWEARTISSMDIRASEDFMYVWQAMIDAALEATNG